MLSGTVFIIVLLWSVGSRNVTVQTGTVHLNLEEEMFASLLLFFFSFKRAFYHTFMCYLALVLVCKFFNSRSFQIDKGCTCNHTYLCIYI